MSPPIIRVCRSARAPPAGAPPAPGHTDTAPGTPVALTKQGLTVACGNGELVLLTQLQAPGGKRMAAPDYFRGHPIEL